MAAKSCCRRSTSCCRRSINDELLSSLAYPLSSIPEGTGDSFFHEIPGSYCKKTVIQEKGEDSLDEYAYFDGILPEMREFTFCFWTLVNFFNRADTTFLSYCFLETDADKKMQCIRVDIYALDMSKEVKV